MPAEQLWGVSLAGQGHRTLVSLTCVGRFAITMSASISMLGMNKSTCYTCEGVKSPNGKEALISR